MAELQQAQQTALATLSLGQQQGAAPDGSSTQQFDIPVQLHPINFAPPSFNGPTPEAVTTTHLTAVSPGVIEVPELKQPLVTIVTPVLAPDGGMHPAIEAINTTGGAHLDTVPSGTLTFTDLKVSTVSASLASITWSAAPRCRAVWGRCWRVRFQSLQRPPIRASARSPLSSAPRPHFRFSRCQRGSCYRLRRDGHRQRRCQLNPAGDDCRHRPRRCASAGSGNFAWGPHTVTQGLITTGTLTFTDVDLNDHHTVSGT